MSKFEFNPLTQKLDLVGSGGSSSPLTDKGDLYTYSTVDTRLPVGVNGTVLTADSAETTGLKWTTPAGGGDVLAPATNTDNYIPQWNGANSKTLKNGIDPATLLTTTSGLKLDQTSSQTIVNGQPVQDILTASEIVATDANKKLQSLDTATYPSLTELSYVKGVTSGVQSQINGKQPTGSYEVTTNKATDFTTINDTLYPSVKAVNDAINSAVVGLLDYRGSYDASSNLFPATGGSGTLGVILKGDFWICSVAGTLGGVAVSLGDLIIALVDTPAQTASNWDLIEHDLGYVPENSANKVTSISGASTDVQYPSAKLLYDQLALKLGTSLTSANIFVGNGSNIATGVVLTGDALLSNTGLLSVHDTRLEVRNETGSTLAVGKAVYISGFNNFPLVTLCDNTVIGKELVIGVVEVAITNNSNGYIKTNGTVSMDTNAMSAVGARVYISTTGTLTTTKPTSGSCAIIGTVTIKDNAGEIELTKRYLQSDICTASSADVIVRMGDSAGTNKTSFRDYVNTEVASIDSDGNAIATKLTTTGAIELGNASDTTIARVSAGIVSIEGSNILVSGGALGTPSSGTVTNLTGTASININGTVGATTATTGKFTTVETTGDIELGAASDTTLHRVSAGVVSIEGNNIITSATVPVKATGTEVNTGTDDAKFLTSKAVADSFLGVQGGWSTLANGTYNDANSLIYAPGVLSGTLTAGMKIRLTDASTTKYFSIRLIATDGGSNNIVFLTGQGGATLSGGAITNSFYSVHGSPQGFLTYNSVNVAPSTAGNIMQSDGSIWTSVSVQAWIEVGAGGGNPAFTNSWRNFNASYSSCAFMKDPFGFVHLKGMVSTGTTNASIFTLPTGYRPAKQSYFAIPSNDIFAEIQVAPDGSVTKMAGGGNTFVGLDGITFRAE